MAAEHEGGKPEHAHADSTLEADDKPLKDMVESEAEVSAKSTMAEASTVEPPEVAIEALLPQRRKAASEDGVSDDEEADDDAFHDAEGEGDGQEAGHTQQQENQEHLEDEPQHVIPAASQAEDVDINSQDAANGEDADLQAEKAKSREPYEVPTSGAFWLHDDRFGEQLEGQQQKGGRKHRSEVEGKWAHDRFNADDVHEGQEGRSYVRGRGRGRGVARGRGRRSPPRMQFSAAENREDQSEQHNIALPVRTAVQGTRRAPMTASKGRSIPRDDTSSARGRDASQQQHTSGRGRGTAPRQPPEQSHDRTPFAGDFGGEFSRQSARHGKQQGNGSAPGRGSSRLPQPSFNDADRKPLREPLSWQQQQQQQQVASGSRRYTQMSGAGRGEGPRNRSTSHRVSPGRGGSSRDESYEEPGLTKRLSANAQEYHPSHGSQKRTQHTVGHLSATAQEFAPNPASPGRPNRSAHAKSKAGPAGPQLPTSQSGSAPTAEDMANFMKQFQAMMPYMQSFLASQAGQPAAASTPSNMPAVAAADSSAQYHQQAAPPTQQAVVTQTMTQPQQQTVQQQSPSQQQQQQAADMQQWIQQAMTHAMAQGQSQEQAWTTVQAYLSQLQQQQQQQYQLQLQQQQQQHAAQLQYQAMPDPNVGTAHMQPVQYQDARYAQPQPPQQQQHVAQVQDGLLSTSGRRFTANRRA